MRRSFRVWVDTWVDFSVEAHVVHLSVWSANSKLSLSFLSAALTMSPFGSFGSENNPPAQFPSASHSAPSNYGHVALTCLLPLHLGLSLETRLSPLSHNTLFQREHSGATKHPLLLCPWLRHVCQEATSRWESFWAMCRETTGLFTKTGWKWNEHEAISKRHSFTVKFHNKSS